VRVQLLGQPGGGVAEPVLDDPGVHTVVDQLARRHLPQTAERQSRVEPGALDRGVEHPSRERTAQLPVPPGYEDEVLGTGARPVGDQVSGELPDQRLRDAQGPNRRSRLCGLEGQPTVDLCDRRLTVSVRFRRCTLPTVRPIASDHRRPTMPARQTTPVLSNGPDALDLYGPRRRILAMDDGSGDHRQASLPRFRRSSDAIDAVDSALTALTE
jgi:hypothetical protein